MWCIARCSPCREHAALSNVLLARAACRFDDTPRDLPAALMSSIHLPYHACSCLLQGAAVFSAHATGPLTPSLLAALGFARGDGITHVHVEMESEATAALAEGMLTPPESCWLPTLT